MPLSLSDAAEESTETESYLKDISSMMTDIDITIRAIGMNTLPFKEGIKRLNTCIFRLETGQYPESLSKQHKTVLLSFKKFRMGLLLFSPERKDQAVGLIKSGTRLLKDAASDIVDIAKREGIIKEEKEEEKEEQK